MNWKRNASASTMPRKNYCKTFIEQYIPPFEDVWIDVRSVARWDDMIQDTIRYKEIALEKDVDDITDEERMIIRRNAEDEAIERAIGVYDQIVGFIRDSFAGKDSMIVFRSIFVDDIDTAIREITKEGRMYYQKKMQGLGVYWAYDIEHAICYQQCVGEEIIVEAEVNCDDVDFGETIRNFLIFSEGSEYTSEGDENEINIKKDRKIRLRSIYRNADPEEVMIESQLGNMENRIGDDIIKIDFENTWAWT